MITLAQGGRVLYRKGLCLFLPFFLILFNCFYGLPSIQAVSVTFDSLPELKSSPAPLHLSSLQIPPELGVVQEVYQGSGLYTVLFIQDAHAIREAQESLTGLIEYFREKHGIQVVALEGTEGRLDPLLFRTFPLQEEMKSLFEGFRSRGEISGAAAASVLLASEGIFAGIEERRLYEAGIRAFLEAQAEIPALEVFLNDLNLRIREAKEKFYGKPLLELDRVLGSFEDSHENLPGLISRLSEISPPQNYPRVRALLKEIRLQESPQSPRLGLASEELASRLRRSVLEREDIILMNERKQAYETSRIDIKDYFYTLISLAAKNGIDTTAYDSLKQETAHYPLLAEMQGPAFFEELDNYIQGILRGLFPSRDAARVYDLDEKRKTLHRLVHLKLTPAEWESYSANRGQYEPWVFDGFLNAADEPGIQAEDYRVISTQASRVSPPLEKHEAFYRLAVERDQAFLLRLGDLMREEQVRDAVMIAGGFHAANMTNLLRAAGISYALITPRLKQVPSETSYLQTMLGNVSWKDNFRAEGGRIRLYDAFARGVVHALMQLPLGDMRGNVFKTWRDEIIRRLAMEGRAEESGRYTRFLDEAFMDSLRDSDLGKLREKWQERADRFIRGVEDLRQSGNLSPESLASLYGSPASVAWASVDSLNYRGSQPASILELARSIREVRRSVSRPVRSELRQSGTGKGVFSSEFSLAEGTTLRVPVLKLEESLMTLPGAIEDDEAVAEIHLGRLALGAAPANGWHFEGYVEGLVPRILERHSQTESFDVGLRIESGTYVIQIDAVQSLGQRFTEWVRPLTRWFGTVVLENPHFFETEAEIYQDHVRQTYELSRSLTGLRVEEEFFGEDINLRHLRESFQVLGRIEGVSPVLRAEAGTALARLVDASVNYLEAYGREAPLTREQDQAVAEFYFEALTRMSLAAALLGDLGFDYEENASSVDADRVDAVFEEVRDLTIAATAAMDEASRLIEGPDARSELRAEDSAEKRLAFTEALRGVLNPDNKPAVVFYPNAGADVLSPLLAVNATHLILSDHLPFRPTGRDIPQDIRDFLRDYLGAQRTISEAFLLHGVDEKGLAMGDLVGILLDVIGARDIREPENLGEDSWRMRFKWQHPGEAGPRERIVDFIGSVDTLSLVSQEGSIPEPVWDVITRNGGVDVFIEKAPNYYRDKVEELSLGARQARDLVDAVNALKRNLLKRGGYLIGDDEQADYGLLGARPVKNRGMPSSNTVLISESPSFERLALPEEAGRQEKQGLGWGNGHVELLQRILGNPHLSTHTASIPSSAEEFMALILDRETSLEDVLEAIYRMSVQSVAYGSAALVLLGAGSGIALKIIPDSPFVSEEERETFLNEINANPFKRTVYRVLQATLKGSVGFWIKQFLKRLLRASGSIGQDFEPYAAKGYVIAQDFYANHPEIPHPFRFRNLGDQDPSRLTWNGLLKRLVPRNASWIAQQKILPHEFLAARIERSVRSAAALAAASPEMASRQRGRAEQLISLALDHQVRHWAPADGFVDTDRGINIFTNIAFTGEPDAPVETLIPGLHDFDAAVQDPALIEAFFTQREKEWRALLKLSAEGRSAVEAAAEIRQAGTYNVLADTITDIFDRGRTESEIRIYGQLAQHYLNEVAARYSLQNWQAVRGAEARRAAGETNRSELRQPEVMAEQGAAQDIPLDYEAPSDRSLIRVGDVFYVPAGEAGAVEEVRLRAENPEAVVLRINDLQYSQSTGRWQFRYGHNTVLALQLMARDAELIRGHVFFDMGAGSGVLAMTAVERYGARQAVAVDSSTGAALERTLEENGITFTNISGGFRETRAAVLVFDGTFEDFFNVLSSNEFAFLRNENSRFPYLAANLPFLLAETLFVETLAPWFSLSDSSLIPTVLSTGITLPVRDDGNVPERRLRAALAWLKGVQGRLDMRPEIYRAGAVLGKSFREEAYGVRFVSPAAGAFRAEPEQSEVMASARSELRSSANEWYEIPVIIDERNYEATDQYIRVGERGAELYFVPEALRARASDFLPSDTAGEGNIIFLDTISERYGNLYFAHGPHTILTLVLMLRNRDRINGHTVYDFGSGTGVLTVAALKLGADRVIALEFDEELAAKITQNAAANGFDPGKAVVFQGLFEDYFKQGEGQILQDLAGDREPLVVSNLDYKSTKRLFENEMQVLNSSPALSPVFIVGGGIINQGRLEAGEDWQYFDVQVVRGVKAAFRKDSNQVQGYALRMNTGAEALSMAFTMTPVAAQVPPGVSGAGDPRTGFSRSELRLPQTDVWERIRPDYEVGIGRDFIRVRDVYYVPLNDRGAQESEVIRGEHPDALIISVPDMEYNEFQKRWKFKHGEHTVLALITMAADEERIRGNTFFDFGMGTGILAMTAVQRYGAVRAVGVELDEEGTILPLLRETLEANGVSYRFIEGGVPEGNEQVYVFQGSFEQYIGSLSAHDFQDLRDRNIREPYLLANIPADLGVNLFTEWLLPWYEVEDESLQPDATYTGIYVTMDVEDEWLDYKERTSKQLVFSMARNINHPARPLLMTVRPYDNDENYYGIQVGPRVSGRQRSELRGNLTELDIYPYYQRYVEELGLSGEEQAIVSDFLLNQYPFAFSFRSPMALLNLIELLFSPHVDGRLTAALDEFEATPGLDDSLNVNGLTDPPDAGGRQAQIGHLLGYYFSSRINNELHEGIKLYDVNLLAHKTRGETGGTSPDALITHLSSGTVLLGEYKSITGRSVRLPDLLKSWEPQINKYLRTILTADSSSLYLPFAHQDPPGGLFLALGDSPVRNADGEVDGEKMLAARDRVENWFQERVAEVRRDLAARGIAVAAGFQDENVSPLLVLRFLPQPQLIVEDAKKETAGAGDFRPNPWAMSDVRWQDVQPKLAVLRQEQKRAHVGVQRSTIYQYFKETDPAFFNRVTADRENGEFDLYQAYLRLGPDLETRERVISEGLSRSELRHREPSLETLPLNVNPGESFEARRKLILSRYRTLVSEIRSFPYQVAFDMQEFEMRQQGADFSGYRMNLSAYDPGIGEIIIHSHDPANWIFYIPSENILRAIPRSDEEVGLAASGLLHRLSGMDLEVDRIGEGRPGQDETFWYDWISRDELSDYRNFVHPIVTRVAGDLLRDRLSAGQPVVIADLGGGEGSLSRAMLDSLQQEYPDARIRLHFVERDDRLVEEARRRLEFRGVTVHPPTDIRDIEDLSAFLGETPDLVVTSGVLTQQVMDRTDVMRVVSRIHESLSPGGYFIQTGLAPAQINASDLRDNGFEVLNKSVPERVWTSAPPDNFYVGKKASRSELRRIPQGVTEESPLRQALTAALLDRGVPSEAALRSLYEIVEDSARGMPYLRREIEALLSRPEGLAFAETQRAPALVSLSAEDSRRVRELVSEKRLFPFLRQKFQLQHQVSPAAFLDEGGVSFALDGSFFGAGISPEIIRETFRAALEGTGAYAIVPVNQLAQKAGQEDVMGSVRSALEPLLRDLPDVNRRLRRLPFAGKLSQAKLTDRLGSDADPSRFVVLMREADDFVMVLDRPEGRGQPLAYRVESGVLNHMRLDELVSILRTIALARSELRDYYHQQLNLKRGSDGMASIGQSFLDGLVRLAEAAEHVAKQA